MIIPAADRLNDVGEYYFSRKLEEIRQMSAGGVDVINLGIGSPDLAPSDAAIEAAASSLRSAGSHGYSAYRSSRNLRQAMSEWYNRVYGVAANPDTEILPLLGSKEGLLYVSMAFLNPGDGVLVPDPGYPAYASVSRLLGARLLTYDLTEANDWLPDFAALEATDLRGVKLMWVNYPHMPTGRAADASVLQKLVEFGRRHRILICHDNPYSLVLNTSDPQSLLRFDPHFEVSLELNSLSKAFNMAGWRVGMILASQAVIDAVLQVKSNVDSGMFAAIQAGAEVALRAPQSWHDERNEVYRERRDLVYEIFDQLGFSYDRKQEGLFVWARAPESVASVEAFLDQVLSKSAVFLTPGFIFGKNGMRYARCSLCASADRLREALKRLKSKN